MLTERRSRILRLIVEEYVESAAPVGSETMVRKYRLPVSPATIRNEMAKLEEEGYITHPYTSAGRLPSDQGYRYYIESLMDEQDLTLEEKETIRHQFHQAGRELEQWVRLSAAVLAQVARNMAWRWCSCTMSLSCWSSCSKMGGWRSRCCHCRRR
jgi:heat-inducible transcriptional repressor